MARAWADRTAAAVDLRTGDPGRAGERALASAAAADAAGAPVEAALSRTLAGVALGRAGVRDRAATELQRAARAFERYGALRHRDEAERELRKLGHHIHRQTRRGAADGRGLESLTGRELQLARLVVDRKTNPQIASELFLSQKTVETHLRNIFRKVGVSSRVDLARAVESAERTGKIAAPG
jgi:DNA-binding NarL/FixJ family response regulator